MPAPANPTLNYVQFDGFVMAAQSLAAQGSYGVGFMVYNGDNSNKVMSRHVWLLNSIVHGFSQAGIALCCGEYQYVIHTTSYDNSNTTCDAQGSGLAINISHTIPGYTPTADDKTNPNSLLVMSPTTTR
jgi:predicted lipase